MKLKITIYDDFHNKHFSGEFVGDSREAIISDAKETWAVDLDCNPEDINITKIEEL